MQRPRHKTLLALGCLLVALVLFPVIEHYRGKWALERWKADMVAKGEKFKIEELIRPPAPEDNAFPDVLFASGRLRANPQLAHLIPPSLRFAAPGKMIYTPGQTRWRGWYSTGSGTGDTNVTWEIFADEMAALTDPLNEAIAALKKPGFDANLNYRFGFNLPMMHLMDMKRLGEALCAAALLDLHRGNISESLEYLESALALSRGQKDERLVISQLVRISISSIAVGATWQALQTPGWNDDQLARLQAGWQSLEFLGAMAHALEMERTMQGPAYDLLRQSNKQVADMLSAYGRGAGSARPRTVSGLDDLLDFLGDKLAEFPRESIYIPLWQFAWSHQDELRAMELEQAMVETARQAAEQKSGRAAAEASKKLEAKIEESSLYDRLRFLFSSEVARPSWDPAGVRWVDRAVESETLRELALTAIALKRYELRHGKPAPNLAALVPEFLPELPRDYMDGKPLRYRLNADGSFLLYSVGQDGQDDGGDATPTSGAGTKPNLQNGRDIVWPAPASAEEIAAEEAKAAKRN
jgi:hypothetical protein